MTAPSWLRSESSRNDASRTLAGPQAPPWPVLLVDDAPEIHEVTRLVLADATFSGRAIELTSAHSAAEARVWLAAHPGTALILLDVVMEADDAGLELVRHIRDTLHDHDVQIILRTGQPGMAPERDVITRYEINGYFLKTELTAQKLTSIVVTGLRTYETIMALRGVHALSAEPATSDTRGPTDREHDRALCADLDAALLTDNVIVHALPQIDLASNAVKGIEMRPAWPTRDGAITPQRIVAMTDDAALLASFDRAMLRHACALARQYRDDGATPAPRVCVPLLLKGASDDELIAMIRTALADANLQGDALDVQFNGALLGERRMAARALQKLGVSITLVDFGLERISLFDLQALCPDRIRIHESFVEDVTRRQERAVVARAIVALAHTLGVSAIADGVSNCDDLQFFRWEGCDLAQGDALAPAQRV
ncbi:response regulator receiver modulated diguanylate cyclase/phosphodiesterase [Caballeronia hypogeia]|uniref:Response regulator receiver modulated diguanylate cyclase/phosphodiesterase n=1 Tax=Caballeronia hypogeia TaxID=1777140 RepID=A0A158C0X2_9BURK|nr:EAL domain-containing protein [Caballeronia hypogeia]SAK76005.1 response regulator receiver modulated diguanylate cyclase/phosphodiesterase [Caballeronia hypogeia]